jgi:DNA-binding FrmR family transcriptional regulator
MTHGYVRSDQKAALRKRLKRIEGQVRGLQNMIEEERYCIDILTQVSATRAALDGVALGVMEDHVRHCVREGGDEKVDELMGAVERLVRSQSNRSNGAVRKRWRAAARARPSPRA